MLRFELEQPADPELFDTALETAVKQLQDSLHHRVIDGRIGPDTRKLLVSSLLARFEPNIFLRFKRPEVDKGPSVFVSYAWTDSEKVDKLSQWLRDHGVRVIRDSDSFVAGDTISNNIRSAVSAADKVVAVLSANSRSRDWPRFEAFITSELESRLHRPVLIYLCLDDGQLPSHEQGRLAILAAGKPLKRVGAEILHALGSVDLPLLQYLYNEDEPL